MQHFATSDAGCLFSRKTKGGFSKSRTRCLEHFSRSLVTIDTPCGNSNFSNRIADHDDRFARKFLSAFSSISRSIEAFRNRFVVSFGEDRVVCEIIPHLALDSERVPVSAKHTAPVRYGLEGSEAYMQYIRVLRHLARFSLASAWEAASSEKNVPSAFCRFQ